MILMFLPQTGRKMMLAPSLLLWYNHYKLYLKVQVNTFLRFSAMKKHDKTLFQIGEITKILGVTRKTLLVYEDMGLLTPAFKDPDSGYRYYSADNMTQIRSIRSLQELGLTLKEIAEYYYDTDNIDAHLQRLTDLRNQLDKNIHILQVRAAKPGDLTVRKISLPRQICFCQRHSCRDVTEAANKLRDTYIAAARTGKMSMNSRMFTMRLSPLTEALDPLLCSASIYHSKCPINNHN